VPTYRYFSARDPDPHTVVADSYERHPDKEDFVTFVNATSFDGHPYGTAVQLPVFVRGDVEIVEE
jgi:hypothetical protein